MINSNIYCIEIILSELVDLQKRFSNSGYMLYGEFEMIHYIKFLPCIRHLI